jgi:hypothetical protein
MLTTSLCRGAEDKNGIIDDVVPPLFFRTEPPPLKLPYHQYFTVRFEVALVMEAGSTCETSVNLYQTTRRNNPEDSHLQYVTVLTGMSTYYRCRILS